MQLKSLLTAHYSLTTFITIALLTFPYCLKSQGVGINDDGSAPTAGAMLDVKSTSAGLLIPRMTEAQRDAINPDTQSMLIYQTNNDSGFYYYDGGAWNPLLVGGNNANAGWSTKGNAGTAVGTHFLGTTDAEDFAIYTNNTEKLRVTSNGNMGIGTTSTSTRLHIEGPNKFSSSITLTNSGPPNNGSYISMESESFEYARIEGSSDNSQSGLIRFYTSQNNTLAASPNMLIDTTGYVGIGTITPQTSLHVLGGDVDLSNHGILVLGDIADVNLALDANEIQARNNGAIGTLALQQNGGIITIHSGYAEKINKIRILDDGNVGIGETFPAGKLHVATDLDGSPDSVMIFTAAGNLGIGTTSPNEILHIQQGTTVSDPPMFRIQAASEMNTDPGDFYSGIEFGVQNGENATGAQEVNAYIKATDTRSGTTSFEDAGLAFGTLTNVEASPSTKMTLTHSGNLGLVTTSPAARLHIDSANSSTEGLRLSNTVGESFSEYFVSNAADSDFYLTYGGTGGADIAIQSDGDIILARSGTGNVGIGETTPVANLHIYQDTPAANDELLRIGTSDDADRFNVDEDGDIEMDGDVYVNGGDVRETGGDLRLSGEDDVHISMDYNNNDANTREIVFGRNDEGNGGNFEELMVINENGNVEIREAGELAFYSGSGNETIRFNRANGNASAAPDIEIDLSALITAEDDMTFSIDADNDAANTTYFDFIKNSLVVGGTSLMRIQEDGNVGIGTTAPTHRLRVSTNSASKPTSSAWTVSSDRRLKREIRPFTDGLNVVKDIETVWFKYNGLANISREEGGVGAIAQNIQEVAPYMVKPYIFTDPETKQKTTYLGVDYGAMDFVLINAIKELSEQNENQQQSITDLKNDKRDQQNQIDLLKAEMREIKKILNQQTRK